MFRRKCKITFIAHGTTIYTEENRLSDIETYPPLNDNGNDEMQRMVSFIKERGVKTDKIYSSPALSTIQSVQIIAKSFKQDFEVLNALSCRKLGNWSGLTYEQIEVKHPDALVQFHQNPCLYCPEGGESILHFNTRIEEVINTIVEKNIGNRVIIVTNPNIIQSAISTALQMPPENQGKIYIKSGSATQINYFDEWASLIYSGCIPA